jgi:hypothetical protein
LVFCFCCGSSRFVVAADVNLAAETPKKNKNTERFVTAACLLACWLDGWLTSATVATFSQKQKLHQKQQQQQQISPSPLFVCLFSLGSFSGNNKKGKLQFFGNNKVTLQMEDTETRPENKLTKPDQTRPKKTKPDQTRPKKSRPDQTGPKKTRPDQTGPKKTRPDQTKPNQTRPDQVGY